MGEEAKGAVRALDASARRDRVLIVEDEDNARKGYEQLLQRWGCEVLGVSNAEDALAKFATFDEGCVKGWSPSRSWRSRRIRVAIVIIETRLHGTWA